jgi:hypothetical protein
MFVQTSSFWIIYILRCVHKSLHIIAQLEAKYNSTHCPVAGNFCCVIVEPTAFNAEFESCVILGKILGFLSPVSHFSLRFEDFNLLTSSSGL